MKAGPVASFGAQLKALREAAGFTLSDKAEGIGAVGFGSVRSIACAGSRPPISVSGGPGPSLPFSPTTWQARQPDCAATSLPASNCSACAVVRPAGAFISISVGEPALAPR